ncbi:MAG: ABC transporter permease, partial [Eubacterium sp.]
MNLLENIKLALEGLRANKMRALLTMLGIIIGISSVIAITSLGNTMSKTMNDSLSNLGGRNIQFYIMPKDMSGSYTMTDEDVITDEMLSRFRERYSDSIKGVEITTSVGAANTVDKVPQADMNITGVNHDYFTVENVEMTQGRAVSDRDTDGAKNVIVISSITSRSLFGDTTNPIGQEIKVETKNGAESFYVIGVFKDP